jgi:hypothetical protein
VSTLGLGGLLLNLANRPVRFAATPPDPGGQRAEIPKVHRVAADKNAVEEKYSICWGLPDLNQGWFPNSKGLTEN